MGGAFLFGCRKPPWCLQKHWDVPLSLRPGLTIAAGALLLSRLCPQQRGQLQQQGAEAGTRAHNPAAMPHQESVQKAEQELPSPGNSICYSAIFLPRHIRAASALPQPQGRILLLTWLLSQGSKVSPCQCRHSWCSKASKASPWPTSSHLCPMWAWARPRGWGSSSTSFCPMRLNPQHLTHLPGGKESWYPLSTPNQCSPASSQLAMQRGEDEAQSKSSPGLVIEFGGKIILFHNPA